MRLALLASILTFAGSIAGFQLASATDASGGGDAVRAAPAAEKDRSGGVIVADCPARRLWEEA